MLDLYALNELRASFKETLELQEELSSFATSENAVGQRLGALLFNSRRELVVTLELKPDSNIDFSRPIKVGENRHSRWRLGKEFPSCQMTGILLGVQRKENRGAISWYYRFVLANVDGHRGRGLRVYVPLSAVVSICSARLGKPIGPKKASRLFSEFNSKNRLRAIETLI